MPPRRFSPRLHKFDYTGPLAAHIVVVTRQRRALFADQRLAEICMEALREAATALNATLHAYCVMPDHVHSLVEVGESMRLTEFPRRFKQIGGYRLKQIIGDEAWQVSFYDHVLRKDEAIVDVARYIWANPVEDGLVDHWLDYAFSGPRELMLGE